eukprot:5774313-Prymnesium_polylepis.1
MAQHGARPGVSASTASVAPSNIVSQADSPRTRVKVVGARSHEGRGRENGYRGLNQARPASSPEASVKA